MKLLDFKKLSPIDYGLLVVFILYIVFPVPTPQSLVPYIDSPIGLVFMFVVTISLFLYTSPILGVLYIFVVYEVLRRNHYSVPASQIPIGTMQMATRVPKSVPTQQEKDSELRAMNPSNGKSLEEEVIEVKAPIGKSELASSLVQSSVQPVAEKSSIGASIF
jgi:hypothetical protein